MPLIRIYTLLTAFLLTSSANYAQDWNIARFGAKGDGVTDNTAFIQQAVDSCHAHGGKVIIPPGRFLSGTIILKSFVTLHVSAGAVLLAHTDLRKYPHLSAGIPFYGEDWAKQALLFAANAEQVSLEGAGIIDGQGALFPVTTDKKPDRYMNRPYLIWMANCRRVSVTGLQLRNSAFWMQHYLGCEYLRIDGLNIWNHSNRNNDMMDIDGCRYVTISNITGDSDDDGITLKSTSPLPTEFVTITNCILSSHCNALKFGTESTGGFRNITISNCVIKPSRQLTTIYGKPAGISGISLEIVDGGRMQQVSINNIVIEGAEVPLFIRLGNRARKHIAAAIEPSVGIVQDVHLSNIQATGAGETGCSIVGIPGAKPNGIRLSNISISMKGGGAASDAGRIPEEKEKDYPEATMFGKLPASGFYMRHVAGLTIDGLSLVTEQPEQRPALLLDDVEDFRIDGLSAPKASGVPLIIINNSKDGVLNNSRTAIPSNDFYRAGKDAVRITYISNRK
ncbi:MAG: glycoside hydrolase family 28 protein [Pseudobacter sp.]|uniref:glycoside hydrolase family 28 protein n=1 Tax=Pseudobacter sp. TaxID=2045420 RepID=UPI003F8205C6